MNTSTTRIPVQCTIEATIEGVEEATEETTNRTIQIAVDQTHHTTTRHHNNLHGMKDRHRLHQCRARGMKDRQRPDMITDVMLIIIPDHWNNVRVVDLNFIRNIYNRTFEVLFGLYTNGLFEVLFGLFTN